MTAGLKKYKESIGFGISIAVLFFILRWFEIRYLIFTQQYDVFFGLVALIFTFLGIWLAKQLSRPKTILIEKEVVVKSNKIETIDWAKVDELQISKRELEVLNLLATGKSNDEIAQSLFVSRNTIKTHIANLYQKLDVKRRTQAVDKAKSFHILE
ncbi:DNA-binding response regulator [Flavobacterium sp. CYK-55]|uniref:response regulator transcription factor n=1 Tax=Flavobacterium sp. CYK-55 TaxID=2835529 RepID=UPI001BCE98EF|nr:LuxR C-terminal-related transcriptional regulator [Flavobacterium sp. CYK-55]MBS7786656.1 DNA-binding response regulator [Flavobacterium sp. CYK-55]